jgi:hypothetical protein
MIAKMKEERIRLTWPFEKVVSLVAGGFLR